MTQSLFVVVVYEGDAGMLYLVSEGVDSGGALYGSIKASATAGRCPRGETSAQTPLLNNHQNTIRRKGYGTICKGFHQRAYLQRAINIDVYVDNYCNSQAIFNASH